jgi:hypothetical protein
MVHTTIRRFEAIRTLVLVGLFAIGLIASTAVPALGSSNTWTPTWQHGHRSHWPYRHAARER